MVSGGKYWTTGTILLLLYGLIKEFRPSVPYLNLYLINASNANLTDEIVSGQVYPYWTYSYLIMLVPVMLLTDWVAYKPIIVSEAAALSCVWALLLWGRTIFHMQLMQVLFGWSTAAEVAYFSYIYVAVPTAAYQRVTSWARMATLIGKCGGYFVGQICMSLHLPDALKLVNYISFGAVTLAAAVAILTPAMTPPKNSSRETSDDRTPSISSSHDRDRPKCNQYFGDIRNNLKEAYCNRQVLKWSMWWAMSTCLWVQVLNYTQVLWSEIDILAKTNNGDASGILLSQEYNGLTESINQLLGALAAYVVQYMKVDWAMYGEISLAILCSIQAVCLLVSSQSANLFTSYVLYVTYCILYQIGITMATFNVAKSIKSSSNGLIFGANMFLAMILQSVLTFIVTDANGLYLPVFTQFHTYAGLQGFLCFIFLLMGIYTLCSQARRSSVQISLDIGESSSSVGQRLKTGSNDSEN
uniref:Uncharacterized protein n=1 Tax=Romanomermis culicivorax TaxID=13658 RepID=A0A915KUI4_ROMCU